MGVFRPRKSSTNGFVDFQRLNSRLLRNPRTRNHAEPSEPAGVHKPQFATRGQLHDGVRMLHDFVHPDVQTTIRPVIPRWTIHWELDPTLGDFSVFRGQE